MREQDDPVVANELMKVNGTLGGLSLEVGGNGAQAQTVDTVSLETISEVSPG